MPGNQANLRLQFLLFFKANAIYKKSSIKTNLDPALPWPLYLCTILWYKWASSLEKRAKRVCQSFDTKRRKLAHLYWPSELAAIFQFLPDWIDWSTRWCPTCWAWPLMCPWSPPPPFPLPAAAGCSPPWHKKVKTMSHMTLWYSALQNLYNLQKTQFMCYLTLWYSAH